MRYRLMASYLGASYQAAVGPSDRDVTLFAAPPPPEEHGFSPVPGGGIWRKQVRLDDLDGLWESRPIGSYHGEPCLVLDDLGDRLHVVYLGMDERRAGQLGYWQVDRGVFEVVVQRHEVTDLAEERHEFPIALLLSALPRALDAGAGAGSAGSMAGLRFGSSGGRRARERRERDRPDRPAQRRPGRERGRRRDLDLERPVGHRDSSAARGPAAAGATGHAARRRAAAPAGRAGVHAPVAAAVAAVAPAVDAAACRRGRPAADDRRLSVAAGDGAERDRRPGRSPRCLADDAAAARASQLPGPQQPGTLPQGPLPPGSQQTQAALPQIGDATSSLSSGASPGPSTSPQFLGGIQSPPARPGPGLAASRASRSSRVSRRSRGPRRSSSPVPRRLPPSRRQPPSRRRSCSSRRPASSRGARRSFPTRSRPPPWPRGTARRCRMATAPGITSRTSARRTGSPRTGPMHGSTRRTGHADGRQLTASVRTALLPRPRP